MSRTPLVICFGDSLTVGFQSPAKDNPVGQETPYGQFLQSLLGDGAVVRTSPPRTIQSDRRLPTGSSCNHF